MGIYDPKKQWREFGKRDPYYGVLSDERFKSLEISKESIGEFYESGEREIDIVLGKIRRTVAPDFKPIKALDFGCGVGRLTIPISRRCQETVGIDVSPGMLEKARKNSDVLGAHGIAWIESDGKLPPLEPCFDFIYSDIVLQHIPVKQGLRIIRGLFRALSRGGIAALHFPFASLSMKKAIYFWAVKTVPFAYNIWNVMKGRPWNYPHMQMNMYDLGKVANVMHEEGIVDSSLEIRRREWTLDALLIARKGTGK